MLKDLFHLHIIYLNFVLFCFEIGDKAGEGRKQDKTENCLVLEGTCPFYQPPRVPSKHSLESSFSGEGCGSPWSLQRAVRGPRVKGA